MQIITTIPEGMGHGQRMIRRIEWRVTIERLTVAEGTIFIPEVTVVLDTEHNINRLVDSVNSTAVRQARLAMPLLGRTARVRIVFS